jgi:type IV pilus assembly protein PilV
MDQPARTAAREAGFSLIELMIALTVLLIGVSGILTMHLTSMRATSYSRHATEAAVLGEDKMEELRTLPIDTLAAGAEVVDAQGVPTAGAPYTVGWNIVWDAAGIGTLTVTVSWLERGSEPHAVVMRTLRTLPPAGP